MIDEVKAVLDEIRPMLQADGGDVEPVEVTGSFEELEKQGSFNEQGRAPGEARRGPERMVKP